MGLIWAPAIKPSWAPRWILLEYLAKLCLGFWVVYGVRSGPQLGPTLDIMWIRGPNWACVSGLFVVYEWVPIGPQPKSPVGPTLDILWIRGLNRAWVSGPSTEYKVGPIWAPAMKPTWAHVGYRGDTLDKLGLVFGAVYRVRSGPQLGPS